MKLELGMITPGQYKLAFIERVMALYGYGYTYVEIASVANMSASAIEDIIEKSGCRRPLNYRRKDLPRYGGPGVVVDRTRRDDVDNKYPEVADLIQARQELGSNAAVAKHFKMGPAKVGDILRATGIHFARKKPANKGKLQHRRY